MKKFKLKKSVRASIRRPAGYSGSIYDSVMNFVLNSTKTTTWSSAKISIWSSLWNSAGASSNLVAIDLKMKFRKKKNIWASIMNLTRGLR